tara:strand:- start:10855 stop:11460 length:606 start_codon:yes stop_codon:yes gene_type:complete
MEQENKQDETEKGSSDNVVVAKKKMKKEFELPEGVSISYDKGVLTVMKDKKESKKNIDMSGFDFKVEGNKVIIEAYDSNKIVKKLLGSIMAHIKNMSRGVVEGHKYVLKICSGHFPMNVSLEGNKLSIKNYLGEKIPRVLEIKEGASVKVENENIVVESISKEIAGQVSADIEQISKRVGFDSRVFQDGIYIIEKDGKVLK